MKNFLKFGLGLALCGMFVACDDSGSSASDESSSSSEVILSSSQNQQSSSSVESVDPESPQGDESSSSSVAFGTMVDARDSATYKTVTIGSQTWMAENLNYAYTGKTSSLDSSSFCNDASRFSCEKYGRLYLWSAAMDSAAVFGSTGKGCGYGATCKAKGKVRGVCPEGWHLPSSDEWETLLKTAGGLDSAGAALKSAEGWSDGEGKDPLGFGIKPAGIYQPSSEFFNDAGKFAYLWSATQFEGDSLSAYKVELRYYDSAVSLNSDGKNYGLSVRCVKD